MYSPYIFVIVLATLMFAFLGEASFPPCGTKPAITSGRWSRIFGGWGARYGSIPWQINLLENGEPKCGGTLIHPKWVVSAAHCVIVSFINTNSMKVYTMIAGDNDISKQEVYEQSRWVIRAMVHPDYNKATYQNDIVLLEADHEYSYNNYVLPACMPRFDETPFPYTSCKASGWGFVNPFLTPDILQEVNLPILVHKSCEVIHHPGPRVPSQITDKVLCAGHLKGKKDTCQGDSGGPLVCPRYGSNGLGEQVLYGIVSWGVGCGKVGKAGVYTNVNTFAEWINKTIAIPPIYNDDPCRFSGIKIQHKAEGEINSPGFGSHYSNNLQCVWEVDLSDITSPSATAKIQFENFDVEKDRDCKYDKVKIYSGDDFDRLEGVYCGDRIPPSVTLSKTRSAHPSLKFRIIFTSDNNIGRKGFSVRFKISD
ncbi:serine protease 1-like [Clavelina lepadiformis]|uniref:Uncharacterized protein n=1 Tax=Clavelina lepadiformis TaxID=159417 RepID=A0ABP0GUB3_CLALP